MAVKWGGRGPGHMSRNTSGDGAAGGTVGVGCSLILDFLNQGYETIDWEDAAFGIPRSLVLDFVDNEYRA